MTLQPALRLVPTANAPAQLPGSFERATGIDLAGLCRHLNVVRRRVVAGEHVYRGGQSFRALFLIHAGHFKISQIAEDGREQVCAFHMRGDLMGIEAIGLPSHCCDAVALEDGEVWELAYPPLGSHAQLPDLQARLTSALAAEIRRERTWMLTIGTLDADQRVAAFLIDVAARHAALGFSPRRFILRMGRVDIASFLALKHETVTRAMTRLCKLGLIAVDKRDVAILDAARLEAIVGGAAHAALRATESVSRERAA